VNFDRYATIQTKGENMSDTLRPEQVTIKCLGTMGYIEVRCTACQYTVRAHSLDSAIDARMRHMARCSTIWESDAEMERRTR
jgi:hypothetical protein